MDDAQQVITGLFAVLTLLGIYRRPRGVAEWQVALAGGCLAWVAGPLTWREGVASLTEAANIAAFFAGLMLLAGAVDAAGLFESIARGLERLPVRLERAAIVAGTPVTALLSNDATPLVLTPAVFRAAARTGTAPAAAAFAVTFIADVASILLPVSNPVALVFFERLDIVPLDYLRYGTAAGIAAIVAMIVVPWPLLPAHESTPVRVADSASATGGRLPARRFRALTITVISAMGFAYLASAVAGLPLGYICLLAGGTLLALGPALDVPARTVASRTTPGVLGFVTGLVLLVDASAAAGLLTWLGNVLAWLAAQPSPVTIAGAIVLAAVVCNMINNWPAALLFVAVLPEAEAHQVELVFGTLIGCTVGANATALGSLSTVFWMALVRAEGMAVSPGNYFRQAWWPTVAALVASGATLACASAFR